MNLYFSVRDASIDDVDALCTIEYECFEKESFSKTHFERLLIAPNVASLIATVNCEAVGFIIGGIESSRYQIVGHLYTLDVVKRFRNKGIADRLVKSIETRFRQAGAKVCLLEVAINNHAAVNLYQKHGYHLVSILQNYYGIDKDGLRFCKNL